jgi:hypothetical protein
MHASKIRAVAAAWAKETFRDPRFEFLFQDRWLWRLYGLALKGMRYKAGDQNASGLGLGPLTRKVADLGVSLLR